MDDLSVQNEYIQYKVNGILPAQLTRLLVSESLTYKVNHEGDLNSVHHRKCKHHEDRGFDLALCLLINHDNTFIILWSFFDLVCCVLSSYFYAWLACFGHEVQPNFFTLIFEIVFSLSMILTLVTTFVPEGEICPVTRHGLIF